MTTKAQLTQLAERVQKMDEADNSVDVLVEVALFKPGTCYTACGSNTAGTKVIYTDRAGNNVTCWAEDWTVAARRKSTAAALLARAAECGE